MSSSQIVEQLYCHICKTVYAIRDTVSIINIDAIRQFKLRFNGMSYDRFQLFIDRGGYPLITYSDVLEITYDSGSGDP